MKRTALKRDTPKSVEWQRQKRKRIKPRSTKTADPQLRAEHDAVRAAVFARDGHRCQLRDRDPAHRCFGHLTAHHLRKEGQGGGYTLANLTTLCVYGNDWCEDHPLDARRLGLVLRAGDEPESLAR